MQTFRMSIAAVAILLAAGEARAQISPVVVESGIPTARVSYADLNLASPAGRLTLDRRVTDAAAMLCLDNERVPLDQFAAQRECYSTALSRARVDIEQAVARASSQYASNRSILVAAR